MQITAGTHKKKHKRPLFPREHRIHRFCTPRARARIRESYEARLANASAIKAAPIFRKTPSQNVPTLRVTSSNMLEVLRRDRGEDIRILASVLFCGALNIHEIYRTEFRGGWDENIFVVTNKLLCKFGRIHNAITYFSEFLLTKWSFVWISRAQLNMQSSFLCPMVQ